MFGKLFLLFTIVPMMELWLLFQLEGQVGWMTTIWIVLVTGIIGASMAKQQGLKVIQDLQQNLTKGIPPSSLLAEGLLVLIGGVLLITPGVMTDAFGFSLIIPFTRKLWIPVFSKLISSKFQIHSPLHNSPFTNPSTEEEPEVYSTPDPQQARKKFNHPKY